MAAKRLLQKLLSLVLTLWATATALFFLSQLLPSFTTPQGMDSTDAIVYGSAAKEATQRVKNDYARRRGLDKPLFYVQVIPLGTAQAYANKNPSSISQFSRQATLWHGKTATEAFLKEWKAFQGEANSNGIPVDLPTLERLLADWANSTSIESRIALSNQFLHLLGKTGQKRTESLAEAWRHLMVSSPPSWYLLPAFQWTGLDNQYHIWLKGWLTGSLGNSLRDYRPVLDKIVESAAVSLKIALPALGLAVVFSLLLGFWLTIPNRRSAKSLVKQVLYMLDSLPGFVITLGLFALFLYAGGTFTTYSTYNTPEFFSPSSLLGSLCVTLFLLPFLTLFFQQSLAQERNKPYLRTAQAKGLSFTKALSIHALPNALAASVVVVADAFSSLVAGILIVEITFSLPGTGSLLTQSLLTKDFPTVIGLTLFLLFLRVILMWAADLVNALLDPRMQ